MRPVAKENHLSLQRTHSPVVDSDLVKKFTRNRCTVVLMCTKVHQAYTVQYSMEKVQRNNARVNLKAAPKGVNLGHLYSLLSLFQVVINSNFKASESECTNKQST